VVAKASPLQFRKWWPGAPMRPGVYDIPMDFVVTEAGIYRAGGSKLELLTAAQCANEARLLLERRGLPRQRCVSSAAAGAAPAPGGYSSPPCYAHEIAPDYFGKPQTMPTEELISLLNALLEAERAGARVLAAFLNDYERDTPA
jgi:hypothetical protein